MCRESECAMEIDRQLEVDNLLECLIEGLEPERIIIFGSHARGDAGPDSDIDILIIKDSEERPALRRKNALQLIKDSRIPKDIVVLTPEEYKDSKEVAGTIAFEAHHFGKVVYVRAVEGNFQRGQHV